jgi:hypothetical protein
VSFDLRLSRLEGDRPSIDTVTEAASELDERVTRMAERMRKAGLLDPVSDGVLVDKAEGLVRDSATEVRRAAELVVRTAGRGRDLLARSVTAAELDLRVLDFARSVTPGSAETTP